MNLDEFYDKVLKLMPYKEERSTFFRNRLRECFKKYQSWIGELQLDEGSVDEDTKSAVAKICDKLNKIVESSMKGLPSTAFTQLRNLLEENDNGLTIDLKSNILKIDAGNSFYRMRQMETIYEKPQKELFHIPIKKRGIVKTQRYSSPGYPCLYLGESIYGCWEEMCRPALNKCAVARLQNTTALYFVDLTIPPIDRLREDVPSFLKLIPLLIACMIRVADDEAIYKPEYIIPQLLIEWLLKFRECEYDGERVSIHGIAYHSTHMTDDFDFPKNKFINYAIPVFTVDPRYDYCKRLCESFLITPMTTHEHEKLKYGYIGGGDYGLEDEEALEDAYHNSDFGQLEQHLCVGADFPLAQLNYKDGEQIAQ